MDHKGKANEDSRLSRQSASLTNMRRLHTPPQVLLLAVCLPIHPCVLAEYYGKFVGYFKTLEHNVSGSVYVASWDAFYLVNFSYDGLGPEAFFWVGTNTTPDIHGEPLPVEDGAIRPLGAYNRAKMLVRLRNNRSVRDYRYLSVFSPGSSENFGWAAIPDSLESPRPQYLGVLSGNDAVVSDGVVLIDSRSIFLPNFRFLGSHSGKVHFMVGNGRVTTGNGYVMHESNRIGGRSGKNVTLTLSEGYSWDQFEWFAVCCSNSSRDLTHVWLPFSESLTVPVYEAIATQESVTSSSSSYQEAATVPSHQNGGDNAWDELVARNMGQPLSRIEWDSFGMRRTARAAPAERWVLPDLSYDRRAGLPISNLRQPAVELYQAPVDPSKFGNCETIVADMIQVAWELNATSITLAVRAKAMPGMWTAFGISGAQDKSQMIGADVAVIFIMQPNNKVTVADFLLTAKSQCSASNGVCSDDKQGGKDDLTVISANYANGIVEAVYSRKLNTGDGKDKPIPPTGSVAVVAAQGPTNVGQPDIVLYHTMIYTKQPVMVEFGRAPKRNCPTLSGHQVPPPDKGNKLFGGRDLFKKYHIDTFTAQIGPTAGDRGYSAITGMSGWGISWWINNELIPVLHVERGKTYKFIVEGGSDTANPARYHPFYITDSNKGGGSHELSSLGKQGNLLFAGVVLDAQNKVDVSKGTGRLCELEEDPNGASDKATTFAEYNKTLTQKCDQGQPGHFTWTPDKNTPNVVYYQCFTHYYLGWKISVTNPGEEDKPLGTGGSEGDHPGADGGRATRTILVSPPLLLLFIGCALARLP